MAAHPVSVAADVDDVAVVREAVDERRGHDLVAEHAAPLLEAPLLEVSTVDVSALGRQHGPDNLQNEPDDDRDEPQVGQDLHAPDQAGIFVRLEGRRQVRTPSRLGVSLLLSPNHRRHTPTMSRPKPPHVIHWSIAMKELLRQWQRAESSRPATTKGQ